MQARAGTAMTTDPDLTRPGSREVVAVAVQWRGRLGLFRRSRLVDHDRGLWHCITGYLEAGATPTEQALVELHEETGLTVADLDTFAPGDVLQLPGADEELWTVHTFRAETSRRRLILNAEHDVYKWVEVKALSRFSNTVEWLGPALAAAGVPGAQGAVRHTGIVTHARPDSQGGEQRVGES